MNKSRFKEKRSERKYTAKLRKLEADLLAPPEGEEVYDKPGLTKAELEEASNKEVVGAFLHGRPSQSGSMRTDGNKLWSYATVIADKSGKKVRLNKKKYSVTTSTQQNLVRRMAQEQGFSVQEVDASLLGENVKR